MTNDESVGFRNLKIVLLNLIKDESLNVCFIKVDQPILVIAGLQGIKDLFPAK